MEPVLDNTPNALVASAKLWRSQGQVFMGFWRVGTSPASLRCTLGEACFKLHKQLGISRRETDRLSLFLPALPTPLPTTWPTEAVDAAVEITTTAATPCAATAAQEAARHQCAARPCSAATPGPAACPCRPAATPSAVTTTTTTVAAATAAATKPTQQRAGRAALPAAALLAPAVLDVDMDMDMDMYTALNAPPLLLRDCRSPFLFFVCL